MGDGFLLGSLDAGGKNRAFEVKGCLTLISDFRTRFKANSKTDVIVEICILPCPELDFKELRFLVIPQRPRLHECVTDEAVF